MRPIVYPAIVTSFIANAARLGADEHDVRLYEDLVCMRMQLDHDVVDLTTRENRKWWAGNLAMCLGDYNDLPVNFAETVKAEVREIFNHNAFKPHAKALWASMVQQITPEHRKAAKEEMIWHWGI